MASRPKLQLESYVPYLVNRLGAALAASFSDAALAPHGLSIAMWRALVALFENGGQRLIDLGAMTSIEVSTLSRMVSRLQRRGLVSRQRSGTNDREVVVALTPKGRALLDRIIPTGLAYERQVTQGVSRVELALVRRVLHQMYRNAADANGGDA